ncbi:MAG TPA: hypothetical protein VK712_02615 [Verrucomicrobiae bacterium]|jgi:hypothetical protein|nr:hypothetical protein [Verrucomicrobiae bacterium]
MSPEIPRPDDESLPPMEVNEQALVKPDRYQSLFLTNGQVYFGKLWVYETFYMITDIYYLQGEAPDQTLVKLGNETHGPEDMQVHSKLQVQFWQNLREEGSVSVAIAQYKEERGLE